MIPEHLLPQTVEIIHFTTGDRDTMGNRSRTPSTPVTAPARLQFIDSKEVTAGQDTVADHWLLFLNGDVQLGAGDHVIEGGRRFRVDGTPAVLWGASAPHHIEARLLFLGDVA